MNGDFQHDLKRFFVDIFFFKLHMVISKEYLKLLGLLVNLANPLNILNLILCIKIKRLTIVSLDSLH